MFYKSKGNIELFATLAVFLLRANNSEISFVPKSSGLPFGSILIFCTKYLPIKKKNLKTRIYFEVTSTGCKNYIQLLLKLRLATKVNQLFFIEEAEIFATMKKGSFMLDRYLHFQIEHNTNQINLKQ